MYFYMLFINVFKLFLNATGFDGNSEEKSCCLPIVPYNKVFGQTMQVLGNSHLLSNGLAIIFGGKLFYLNRI